MCRPSHITYILITQQLQALPPTFVIKTMRNPHPSSQPPLLPYTDLIIASCRVSVSQKCEWRSEVALTKGRSWAPLGRPDKLATGAHTKEKVQYLDRLVCYTKEMLITDLVTCNIIDPLPPSPSKYTHSSRKVRAEGISGEKRKQK